MRHTLLFKPVDCHEQIFTKPLEQVRMEFSFFADPLGERFVPGMTAEVYIPKAKLVKP